MRALSPWELARSADGPARAVHADPRAAAAGEELAAVGGAVLTRAGLLLVLTALVAQLPATGWDLALVLAGTTGPVVYTWLYLRSSTATAREVLVASLRRGYRVSLVLGVVAAATLVRHVGVRQGWVGAPLPPAPWAVALLAVAAVRAQTSVLGLRVRRGR